MDGRQVARALAWFGVGLGIAEVLAPRHVAKAIGVEGHSGMIRAFGVREIVSGTIVLAADEPEEWLWVRVVGDGLDSALLASAIKPANPGWLRAIGATIAVAPVVMLDVLYARWPLRQAH